MQKPALPPVLYLALITGFGMLINTTSAQNLKLKYFHLNGSILKIPANNDLVQFINSYNTFAPKPAGVTDYSMKVIPGLTGTLLAGFSYKKSRNLFTIPFFFGESMISSNRRDAPKSTGWKNLNFTYVGTGIGYMGFLFPKEIGKHFYFPKLEYQVSLNGEVNSFLYSEAGISRKEFLLRPSTTAFIQYNFYPPSEISENRVAFGITLQYHTTLMPVNLAFLERDFNYAYQASLNSAISTISAGLSITFLGKLNDKATVKKVPPETLIVKVEAEDDVTKRKVNAYFKVRDSQNDKRVTPSKGYYTIVKKNSNFPALLITANAKGYFSKKQTFTPYDSIHELKISMHRIRPEISMATLYFHHTTTDLADSSQAKLYTVLEMLRANPGIKIIIKGYTSSEGSGRKNLKLSRDRARFVKNFLVTENIGRHRVETIGLGAADRIYPDDTEQHRAFNRRAEIFIIKD